METDVNMLIRRSLAGDASAFEALFHQYKNLVFKTAFLMLGNADEAEDVLQEVFLEVHRVLPSYQASKGAFSTWLHRITVNDCISWQRKWRRSWKRGFMNLAAITQDTQNSPNATVPTQLTVPGHEQITEDLDSVRRVLGQISNKLRAVVVLRFYWDMSYADIAQAINIPIGTVKSRLNQALQLMRHSLDRTVSQDKFELDQLFGKTLNNTNYSQETEVKRP